MANNFDVIYVVKLPNGTYSIRRKADHEPIGYVAVRESKATFTSYPGKIAAAEQVRIAAFMLSLEEQG